MRRDPRSHDPLFVLFKLLEHTYATDPAGDANGAADSAAPRRSAT